MNALRLVLSIIFMIPAIAVLLVAVFLCVACSLNAIACYYTGVDRETASRRIMAQIGTPSTTLNAAPAAANATHLDDTQIKSCSELIVLETNGSKVQGQCEKNGCSICLEEYCANEKARQISLCQHFFHADCVDHWFQKNSTCPICRVSVR